MYDAMVFLDTVPHDWAEAVADADRAAYRISMAEAVGIMVSQEKSADRRKAEARNAPNFSKAVNEHYAAQLRMEELKAKRAAAQLKVEVWRTIHADKRQREVAEPGQRDWPSNWPPPPDYDEED